MIHKVISREDMGVRVHDGKEFQGVVTEDSNKVTPLVSEVKMLQVYVSWIAIDSRFGWVPLKIVEKLHVGMIVTIPHLPIGFLDQKRKVGGFLLIHNCPFHQIGHALIENNVSPMRRNHNLLIVVGGRVGPLDVLRLEVGYV